MTISVHGIGWITREGCGCVRKNRHQRFGAGEEAGAAAKKEIFSHPFRNFGRMDPVSRTTAYAVALALQDAGIRYAPDRKQDIGIIGTNSQGSLRTDIEYFRDYVNSGRTLSRGNLFIYTLPSSPFGEAAIHFGFLGPLLYATSADHSLAPLADMASGMVRAGEAGMMLFGRAEEESGVFFVTGKPETASGAVLCTVSDARSVLESAADIATIVERFSQETEKIRS